MLLAMTPSRMPQSNGARATTSASRVHLYSISLIVRDLFEQVAQPGIAKSSLPWDAARWSPCEGQIEDHFSGATACQQSGYPIAT